MQREQVVAAVREAARALNVERLSITAFRQQSGISQSAVLKWFDSWSDACLAAGVACGQTRENLVSKPRISEEECISEMRRISSLLGRRTLSSKEFSQHACFTAKPVIERFGSWQSALCQAGLELCEGRRRQLPLAEDECIAELQRVAAIVGTTWLTQDSFEAHARFSAFRVARACGGWVAALEKADLSPSVNYRTTIPSERLATAFLRVVTQLGRIPTLQQLVRRSEHSADTFSRNRGGYATFKRDAIAYLLEAQTDIAPATRAVLEAELGRLGGNDTDGRDAVRQVRHHYQGRTLNFRAFTYAPTCEHDVVQMFGSVAGELGFEIIGNRSEFPDCEARRRVTQVGRERYEKCLIEYEFASADYRRHKHPLEGCHLIVCWQHDWPDCPIEVLELQHVIRQLDGWR